MAIYHLGRKILRIDINDSLYTIPFDNPFIYNKKARDEIWAYGLRNPWRFSFDFNNELIIIADVGQNSWEEINYISSESKGGDNFGWNIMEASSCFPEDTDCSKASYKLPVFEYPNDAKYVRTLLGIRQKNVHGCSVTGGYVYRGNEIPELYGRYFFGDYCTGRIWSFELDRGNMKNFKDHTKLLLDSINKKKFYLSSFGETEKGELLLVNYSGAIYKLSNR